MWLSSKESIILRNRASWNGWRSLKCCFNVRKILNKFLYYNWSFFLQNQSVHPRKTFNISLNLINMCTWDKVFWKSFDWSIYMYLLALLQRQYINILVWVEHHFWYHHQPAPQNIWKTGFWIFVLEIVSNNFVMLSAWHAFAVFGFGLWNKGIFQRFQLIGNAKMTLVD